jgi:hypothetical protein
MARTASATTSYKSLDMTSNRVQRFDGRAPPLLRLAHLRGITQARSCRVIACWRGCGTHCDGEHMCTAINAGSLLNLSQIQKRPLEYTTCCSDEKEVRHLHTIMKCAHACVRCSASQRLDMHTSHNSTTSTRRCMRERLAKLVQSHATLTSQLAQTMCAIALATAVSLKPMQGRRPQRWCLRNNCL